MMKKLLFALILITCCVMNSQSQIWYSGSTNNMIEIWDNGGNATQWAKTTDSTGGPVASCGGDGRQMVLDYRAPKPAENGGVASYWAGNGGFSLNNWGGTPQNYSTYTHVRISYKWAGATPLDTLVLNLSDGSITGPNVKVVNGTDGSAGCVTVEIPLCKFVGTSGLDLTNIASLSWFPQMSWYSDATLEGWAQGTFYLDDMQVVAVGLPEINVQAGPTNVASGATVDFSSLGVGSTKDSTFTIQNLGSGGLTLFGKKVSIAGDVSEFTIVQTGLTSPVSASGSTSFTITFNPTSAGVKNASIVIRNFDCDESIYVINLTGTGVPAPEINVQAGPTNVASGATVDFGSLVSGSTKDSTFTIQNLGDIDLTLSGTTIVSIAGADASEFTIVQTGVTSPVSASGSTSFTITFNPTSAGVKNANITIGSNDGDEGTYVINLTGTGTATPEPEINVKVGSTNVASAGTVPFGSTGVGLTSAATTFTIENNGSAVLTLSGNPSLSGTNQGDFAVDATLTSSPVSISGTTTFTVTFTPSASGARTADLTITSDDSDEGSYVITLTGSGVTGLFSSSSSAGSDTYAAYPSPFADEAVIKINSTVNAPMSIKVLDTKGTVVSTSEGHFTNEDITLGKGLEKGIYFVQVAYQNRVQVIKIVKM